MALVMVSEVKSEVASVGSLSGGLFMDTVGFVEGCGSVYLLAVISGGFLAGMGGKAEYGDFVFARGKSW